MTLLNDTSSVLAFLHSRKSASAKAMAGPGPSPEQIAELLDIAVRVPDHGKLAPWRFTLFEGQARAEIGEEFAAIWAKLHPVSSVPAEEHMKQDTARRGSGAGAST